MNDLRHDQEAAAATPAQLRAPNYIWVQVPIDGVLVWTAVDVPAQGVVLHYDTRTHDERTDAAIAKLNDMVTAQGLMITQQGDAIEYLAGRLERLERKP